MPNKVEMLNLNTYPDFGLIATIRFPKNAVPKINDLVEDYNGNVFRIDGIVVTSKSDIINQRMENGIYDCKVTSVQSGTGV